MTETTNEKTTHKSQDAINITIPINYFTLSFRNDYEREFQQINSLRAFSQTRITVALSFIAYLIFGAIFFAIMQKPEGFLFPLLYLLPGSIATVFILPAISKQLKTSRTIVTFAAGILLIGGIALLSISAPPEYHYVLLSVISVSLMFLMSMLRLRFLHTVPFGLLAMLLYIVLSFTQGLFPQDVLLSHALLLFGAFTAGLVLSYFQEWQSRKAFMRYVMPLRQVKELRSAYEQLQTQSQEIYAQLSRTQRELALERTARKKATESLSENEGRFKEIYENASIGIYQTTIDGKILMANPAMIAMLGYESFDELCEINNAKTKHLNKNRDEYIDKLKEMEDVKTFESVWTKRDGTKINIRESARVIKDNDGEILYLEGTIEDITDIKLAEKALIAAKQKAEEANRLKTTLIDNMSHELRTPMIGIMGFAELLEEELEETEYAQMISSIILNSNRLMHTLNTIIDLAELETYDKKSYMEEISLGNEIVEVAEDFTKECEKHGLQFTFDSINYEVSVKVDRSLLKKMLYQLFDNAMKFTEQGGITVTVFQTEINNKNYASIKIMDTGIGIAKHHQEIIFTEFRQASEGLSRRYEGTGIGLSLCKRIVDIHDGIITLESEPGVGSTFTVSFPITKKNDEEDAHNHQESKTA